MRKHARSWLIKVALGGIIIVFIFWYGWSGPVDQNGNFVANVNGTIVTYDYFRSVYYSEEEKIKLRFGGTIPPGLLEKLNLKKKIVAALVNQLVLLQKAEELGLFVTDEDLVADIRNSPSFQRNGVFDDYLYKAYLRQIKMNAPFYESVRRQELLETQLAGMLTDGVKTDPGKIKKLWQFQNNKLVLSMLLFRPEAKGKETGRPDEEALGAYFRKNQEKYEIPASVALKYVLFSWRDVQKDITVSDEEIRGYYGSNPKEFTDPEQIHARHILLKVPKDADEKTSDGIKKKIEEILAGIKGGEDFEKAAAAESQDETTAKKGGDLGFFGRGTMNPDLEKIAFELEPGEISDPVLTSQGYHLIRVDEKKAEKVHPFDAVKEKLGKKLLEDKARGRIGDAAEDFYEKVYRAEQLQKPAEEFGFEVKTAKSVTKAQGIPDAGKDPKVMDEAFQLQTDEISKIVRSGENFIVMKLVEKIDERLPELQEVRASVVQDYLDQQATLAAQKRAEEVIEALKKDPSDPDGVAKKFGLKWEKLDPVSRTTGIVPRLGDAPEVTEMLTTVSKAAPLFPRTIPVSGGAAVVRLADVEPAGEELYAQEREAFEKWIVEVRKTEFVTGWLRVLKEGAEITVNEKRL